MEKEKTLPLRKQIQAPWRAWAARDSGGHLYQLSLPPGPQRLHDHHSQEIDTPLMAKLLGGRANRPLLKSMPLFLGFFDRRKRNIACLFLPNEQNPPEPGVSPPRARSALPTRHPCPPLTNAALEKFPGAL